MLRLVLAFGFAIVGTIAQANSSEQALPEDEYDKSYLQVEGCFATESTNREACVIAGIQECVKDLEAVLESKGFLVLESKGYIIPQTAYMYPYEYCNYIGLERADEYLNAVYQRILERGPLMPSGDPNTLRTIQRLWIEFANEMCSINIMAWYAGGGPGWGAEFDECRTRLSIQQAENLARFYGYDLE